MRLDKPGNLALLITLLAAGMIVLVVMAIVKIYQPDIHPRPLALLILLPTLVIYIAARSMLSHFLYSKIKVIYKNIHELKVGSEEDEETLARTSDLRAVEQEVAEWAEERNNEIKDLQSRETFRREFIGNVSHELKTPIFNIQGYILTLLDGAIDDPKINTKYLKRANKSVERMINLVQDMDMINKLESGIIELKLQTFDIIQLVRDVFEVLEDKAIKYKTELILHNPAQKPIMVHADIYRIEQVLINLVTNAIKYGRKEGKVEVQFFDMEDKYLIEVSDNGYGIPEKDLSRVFERFYRVDKSRTRDAGGSGLGLSIVKHIIDAHKQSINVRSTEGVGSAFSFTLKKGK